MKKRKIIEENWGDSDFFTVLSVSGIEIAEYLEIAYSLKLYEKSTPNVRRSWTKSEDEFIKDKADDLTIDEVSNLVYRSYHAVYQRVRFLDLRNEMINRK